jgi:HK97 family phage portal protein
VSVLGSFLRDHFSIEDPGLPLTSTVLADWLGGERSDAGVRVTEKRVYGIPAYYRGVAITAGTLAGLPVKVYVDGTSEQVRQKTVLDNPNPRQTPFEFRFTLFANGISWGNAFAFKVRDGADIVRETWSIHPSRVRVYETEPSERDPAGKLFEVTFPSGEQGRYSGWDIFHLPYLSPDGVAGLRPLHVMRQALGIAIAAEDSAAALYGNGSMLSGILTTDQELDNDAVTALKRRWKALVGGPRRAGEIGVLDRGAKFEAVALPPGDAQLLESRRFSLGETARIIGIPPHLIGDVERSTSWGTGIEQQVLGWVKFSLSNWILGWEQRATRELLPGGWSNGTWFAKSILEGLLRGDSKARAEFYRVLASLGAISPAFVRDKEDLEPVEGLDFYTIPRNQQIVAGAGADTPAPAEAA